MSRNTKRQIRAYSYLRWSKKAQGKGDSERRQTVASSVCATRGWILDTSLVLRDDGVSSYKGRNRKLGALGTFLEAVGDGRVKPGSVLIIEDIDRLSREDIPDALPLFMSLINADITIYVVRTEREYSKETIAVQPFIIMEALLSMILAHEESSKKAFRSRAWWEGRRSKATLRPITPVCPSWLILDKTTYTFSKRPDAVAAVKRIFSLAFEGHGLTTITRMLVSEGVPAIGRSGRWLKSTVQEIVTNRALVGEFQPCIRDEDGRHVPIGQPIEGYYPAIITLPEFKRMQTVLTARRVQTGPASGDIHNLFTGLLRSNEGGTMMLSTSMQKGRMYHYLASSTAVEGCVGKRVTVPYAEYETVLLQWLREITPASLTSETPDDTVSVLEAQRDDKADRIKKIQASLEGDGDCASLISVLKTLERQHGEILDKLDEATARLEARSPATLLQTQTIIGLMETATGDERKALRTKLRTRIKELVESITIKVVRTPPKHRTAKVGTAKLVYLTITFRTGTERRIWYETGSGKQAGVWSPTDALRGDDMLHMMGMHLAEHPEHA